MAHADYACCAVCDCKMDYVGFDAPTKASICPDCIERSNELGTLIVRPHQIIDRVKDMADDDALVWLHKIGMHPCYYANDVDEYLIERGLIETGVEGAGSWGKRLRPLG
jgi:hypothetical protein